MLKYCLFGLVAVIAILCVVISMQPNEFMVSRSAIVKGTPDQVFAEINNLENMQDWSPWADLDPEATVIFEGPSEGVDAKMSWDGNFNIGKGSMTILESKPNELVHMRLDFEKPMKGTSTAMFVLESVPEGTKVTWSSGGAVNFVGKAMGLIIDCEKMMGEQFEKGLSNLSEVVQKS